MSRTTLWDCGSYTYIPITEFGRSQWLHGQSMNCLRPLKRCDRGFESHLRHGCLCAFILCLCCPVYTGSGFATG
jgi:hypothetical protein